MQGVIKSIASKSLLCPTKFIVHIAYCTIHLTFAVYLLQHKNCFLCNAFCIMDLRHRIFLIASYILHFTHYLSAYTMLITYCILHILTYITSNTVPHIPYLTCNILQVACYTLHIVHIPTYIVPLASSNTESHTQSILQTAS